MEKVRHLGAAQPVVSREYEDQRKIAFAKLVLNREQADPKGWLDFLVFFFAHLAAELGRLEHRALIIPRCLCSVGVSL